MSVIRKQSINYTLVHFTGVLIGVFSTILIYPLEREAYGLARFLIDFSILLYPFVLLGFENVAIRFFPDFRNAEGKAVGFLGFLFWTVIGGCAVLALIAGLWGMDILHWMEQLTGMRFVTTSWIEEYIWLSIPVICFMGVAWLFNQYLTNFHKVVVPAMLQNAIKVSLPLFILLYHYKKAGIAIVAEGIAWHFAIVAMLYMVYTYLIGQLKLGISKSVDYKSRMGDMTRYAAYSLFGSLGTLIAFRIDSIMVSTLLGLEFNGDFGIASTIAQTIAIPTNAVIAIGSPVIAAAWADKNTIKIADVYRKSSINLLIPGLLIYTGMWLSLEDLVRLMPNHEAMEHIRTVVLLLGFSRIVDMGTSVNNEIIAFSKYYRFNFVAVILLALCNIVFNFYFIALYGIWGAALATALSLALYNVAKFIFIWRFLGMQPFSMGTVKIILIALAGYGAIFWWPDFDAAWLGLLVKSSVLVGIYGFLVWKIKLSPDLNAYLCDIVDKVKRKRS
jgi:O-antigen/teichoic acid export membrane protein